MNKISALFIIFWLAVGFITDAKLATLCEVYYGKIHDGSVTGI